MRLKNKVAMITGASKGIGHVTAEQFVEEGAAVVVAARTKELLDEFKIRSEKKGGTVLSLEIDMRDKEQIKYMIDTAYKKFNRIDILFNNAGLPMFGYAIDDMSDEAEKRCHAIVETNLMGYWYAAHYVVPYMKDKESGCIINNSSIRGKGGIPNDSAYLMVKGGVDQLTRALAVELAPFNIRVNTISPGAIQVALGHWVLSRYGEEVHKKYVDEYEKVHLRGMEVTQPLRTVGRPSDIAYAVVYLASNEARFVTGADLVVDGGLTATLAETTALDLETLCSYHQEAKKLRNWLSSLE